MTEYVMPDPIVDVSKVQELGRELVVIPDRGVALVPNIGVIGGSQAVLIVDTGMGPRNAEQVLKFAVDYAAGRRVYLTTTHFHPEHAFGAKVFANDATYLANRAQADDLATKGPGYLPCFAVSVNRSPTSSTGLNCPRPTSCTTTPTSLTSAAVSWSCGRPGKPTPRATR